MRKGSAATFTFAFEDAGGRAVELESFYFTVVDLDGLGDLREAVCLETDSREPRGDSSPRGGL